MSANGDVIAAGAIVEDSSATGLGGDATDNSAADSGAAYLFVRTGGTWSQAAYVKASNTGAGDYFGSSVGLSGDGSTFAVGAERESSNATGIGGNQSDNSLMQAGAMYVFTAP
ncbi:MAG: hypothetical protein IPK60_09935 [Sandaracinaceae bacterium]|nr:hypothetical protein [Sandaracinaceae bacterium]